MDQTITVGMGMDDAASVLVAGLQELMRMDHAKQAHGREHWSPGLQSS